MRSICNGFTGVSHLNFDSESHKLVLVKIFWCLICQGVSWLVISYHNCFSISTFMCRTFCYCEFDNFTLPIGKGKLGENISKIYRFPLKGIFTSSYTLQCCHVWRKWFMRFSVNTVKVIYWHFLIDLKGKFSFMLFNLFSLCSGFEGGWVQ